jgi:hypothetical protein
MKTARIAGRAAAAACVLIVLVLAECSIFKTILTVENRSGGTITNVYVFPQGGSPGSDLLAGGTIPDLTTQTLRSELFRAGAYTIRIIRNNLLSNPWDYNVVFDGSKYTLTVTTQP